ncbi:uncharacterized protein LOC112047053 [Bicyclus anynana]|uniref:Uncharacterized protein LOC112047053 n=1 Tax=Bicyclus anynana TaxID=110368 RepID=A0A6J1N418_BICAN|nr:uncharacterized protein LOC112047053 [Bicyclus anynana]
MFDTERFISEVHMRECIWNSNLNEYGDRILRRRAWEEIGSVIYQDWEVFGGKTKNETVQELQKKWKHLRDYFIREKNKKNSKSEGVTTRKRKRPFLEMLEFLTLSKDSGNTTSNMQPTSPSQNSNNSGNTTNEEICESFNTDISLYMDNSLHTDDSLRMDNLLGTSKKSKTSKSKKLTQFQKSLLKSIKKQEQINMNPHMNFFLTLLPEMQAMSESQVFEFKFEIMRLLQRVKYTNGLVDGSGPSSSSMVPKLDWALNHLTKTD